MTNFNKIRDATGIIEEVFELIDEDYLYRLIDKRIEEAAVDFKFDRKAPLTHQAFIRIIGDFVYHVYKNGLCVRQTLSAAQARAEAMALLEKCYESPHANGYFGAFLDVSNSKMDTHESILIQIAEIIKALAREKYIKWVYFNRIISLDWPVRCQIAEILIKRWAPFLPLNISQCSPAQLADHLPDLIEVLRSTDGTVRKMLNADFDLNSI